MRLFIATGFVWFAFWQTPRLIINTSRSSSDTKLVLAFSPDALWLASTRKNFDESDQDTTLISIIDMQACADNPCVCTAWMTTDTVPRSKTLTVARNLRTPGKTTIRSIVFSSTNSDLYAGSGDGRVLIFSLFSGTLLRTIDGVTTGAASSKQSWITNVMLSPDSCSSLACVTEKALSLVELADDTVVRKVNNRKSKSGKFQNVKTAVFSADSRYACFVTEDGTASVSDIETGYQIDGGTDFTREHEGRHMGASCAIFTPRGDGKQQQLLVSYNHSGGAIIVVHTIRNEDASLEVLHEVELKHHVHDIAFPRNTSNPNSASVALRSDDGIISFVPLKWLINRESVDKKASYKLITIDVGLKWFLDLGMDDTLRARNDDLALNYVQNDVKVIEPPYPDEQVVHVRFDNGAKQDVPRNRLLFLTGMTWNLDETWMAVCTTLGTVILIDTSDSDVAQWSKRHEMPGLSTEALCSVAFSGVQRDHLWVLLPDTLSANRNLARCYDLSSIENPFMLTEKQAGWSNQKFISLSPKNREGKELLATGSGRKMQIIDPTNKSQISVVHSLLSWKVLGLRNDRCGVVSMAWSPNGCMLIIIFSTDDSIATNAAIITNQQPSLSSFLRYTNNERMLIKQNAGTSYEKRLVGEKKELQQWLCRFPGLMNERLYGSIIFRDGWTLWHEAVVTRNEDLIELLSEATAETKSPFILKTDATGQSALSLAVTLKPSVSRNVVECLLDNIATESKRERYGGLTPHMHLEKAPTLSSDLGCMPVQPLSRLGLC